MVHMVSLFLELYHSYVFLVRILHVEMSAIKHLTFGTPIKETSAPAIRHRAVQSNTR